MATHSPAAVKAATAQLFAFQAPLGSLEELTEATYSAYERRARRILDAAAAAEGKTE